MITYDVLEAKVYNCINMLFYKNTNQTVEQIVARHLEDAYNSGNNDGYNSGYDKGYSNGHNHGYDEGYWKGRREPHT